MKDQKDLYSPLVRPKPVKMKMMRKLLPVMLLLLASCRPAAPTLPPTQSLSEVQTAAASTVESVWKTAAATPPMPIDTPDLSATPPQTNATVTPIVLSTAQSGGQAAGDFWVTYVSQGKLWISKADSSMPTRLTNTPAQDFLPDWSPDGEYLAFLRFYGSDALDGNLLVMTADSNTPELLAADRTYTSFAWLSDSRTLLAVSGDMRLPDSYLIDVETGNARKLEDLSGGHPVLSPDRTKIAALVAETGCQGENCLAPNDLFVYDIDTGQTKQLTTDSTPKEWLAWSPDGKLLSYEVRGTDLEFRDYIAVDGADEQWIDQPVTWWAEVIYAISPDGKQIAFATPTSTNGTGTTEVFVMPYGLDNSAAKPVATLSKADQGFDPFISSIIWLPDSSGVVFDNFGKLFVAPVSGSGLKELPIDMEKTTYDLLPISVTAYSPPPEPTAPAQWHACPGGLKSNLAVGMKASVSSDPPTPNNVRAGPSTKNTRRGQIQPGEVVEILSGPECAEDMIWWEVRSPSTGLTGWTAEGTLGSYWLSPDE